MKKQFLIIFTLLLSLTAVFSACESKGENYNLEQLEKGSLYLKADTADGKGKLYYVRFNPSMIFFMLGDLDQGKEIAAQYYVKHDVDNHTVTTDHCVFTHHASDEFVDLFLNKTIKLKKEGDKMTIKGINDEFDGTYIFRGDDDSL